MILENWYEDVLNFWFTELTPKQWFMSDKTVDAIISKTFKPLVLELAENLPENIHNSPETSLAGIICFDQFTRNIFRGDGTAFAYDHLALSLATHILDKGWDQNMDADHKQFSYMPFMHSEDLQIQQRSLQIFKPLGEGIFKFAQSHHDIIAKFGRYPHRNEVLGRDNTSEEIEYLKNAQRFGQ